MQVGSSRPLNKISGGALASAVALILSWALRTWAGVEIPIDVQGAIAIAVYFGASYLIPIAPGEIVATDGTPITENT